MHLLARLRRAALDLALPPRCRSCDAELDGSPDGALLCPQCDADLAYIDWPVCPRCVAPMPIAIAGQVGCLHCKQDKLKHDGAIALVSYEGLAAQLIQRMKADASGIVARLFVDLLFARRRADLDAARPDVVAPIPPHGWLRGGQSGGAPRLLAEIVAQRLRVPVADRLLALKSTASRQVGLSRAGRFANMHRQMVVGRGHTLSGARVLVVDDILTSCATVSEAARALKAAGAAEVHALAIGRTPPQDLAHTIL